MRRRRQRAGLNPRLTDARTPVFLLDHRRRIVFFNAGCEHLTGRKAAEVIGRVCDYATAPPPAGRTPSPSGFSGGSGPGTPPPADGPAVPPADNSRDAHDDLAALTGSLCPPPEVLAGTPQSVPAYLPSRDGRPLARQIHFYPLVDADGRVESVLGLITPLDAPRPRVDPTPAQRLHAELASLRLALRQRFSLDSIVCAGESMQRVLVQIHLARAAHTPVALEGEPGTGREHVARVVHYTGPARSRSFVPLDCRRMAAIDLKLALRRLLGAEDESPGEWSVVSGHAAESDPDHAPRTPHAPQDSPLAAHSAPLPGLRPGTLYLANVECLPRDVQQLLVETFTAGAGPAPRRSTAAKPAGEVAWPRLIVSTSVDLDALLADETLRPDFFYLVTPLRIALPPLRRRPEDLAPLAQAFLEALNRGADVQLGGFSEGVWAQFREYHWPGNLDELAVVIAEARAAAVETGGRGTERRDTATQRPGRETERPASEADAPSPRRAVPLPSAGRGAPALITTDHLPFRFRTGLDAQALGPKVEPRTMPLEPYLEQIERDQILAALEQVRYSKTRAADLLGMTRPRLYRRMEALGIEDREPAETTAPPEVLPESPEASS